MAVDENGDGLMAYLDRQAQMYHETGESELSDDEHGYRDWETDRKSTRLNSSHSAKSRMPSSA